MFIILIIFLIVVRGMLDGAGYKNAIGDQVYFGYILDMDFSYCGKISCKSNNNHWIT